MMRVNDSQKPEYKGAKEGFNNLRTSKRLKVPKRGGVGSQTMNAVEKDPHECKVQKQNGTGK